MKSHASLTFERVLEAAELAEHSTCNPGFCKACGDETSIEPDARDVECDVCGELEVFGAAELLMDLI